jgi:hypothetical protein
MGIDWICMALVVVGFMSRDCRKGRKSREASIGE